jgi:hypothetical protein
VKRKPARKPAKRKRSARVQGIPVGGGWIQGTFFPLELRPAAEVRAEQDGGILHGQLEPVKDDLRTIAKGILENAQRYEMDHSDKPHRFSWGPGLKHFYTAEESVLESLVEEVIRAGFEAAVERYRSEVADLVARLERQTRILEERRENGQILAAEGRAARKPKTDRHAEKVCRIYKRVRPSFPPGRAGNGAALVEVSRRAGPSPGYEKPMTKTGIRKLLGRCGVPCR